MADDKQLDLESSNHDVTGDADKNIASKGATILILTQIVSKFLTFVLNQLLVRSVSPTLFGISSYLDFLYSTILLFSREAERLSIQRTKSAKNTVDTYQTIINFGYIPLLIGIPTSTLILNWQWNNDTFNHVRSIANYVSYTLLMYWVLIILELIIEPFYALNQYTLNFTKRSKYESIGLVSRCILTVIIIGAVHKFGGSQSTFNKNGLILLSFGVGQFVYSFVLFVSYFKSSYNYSIKRFPHKSNQAYFDSDVLRFWRISFIQMIFKQFLTEGDKFLVNTFFSVEERGVYSVMGNYGSIVARLLFQPIEESIRLSFTRALSQIKTHEGKSRLYEVLKTLKFICIFYLQLLILIVLGGYFNGSFLLKVLLGGKSSTWVHTNLFDIFPWYITYIPFLAFNGVFEGFVMSIADSQQTKSYSYFMTLQSIVILFILYVFIEKLQLGISGLILANVLNMICRIIYCTKFINEFFTKNLIIIPHYQIYITLLKHLIIACLGFYSNHIIGQTNSFRQLLTSGFICLICLLAMLVIGVLPYMKRNKAD